MQRRSFQVCAAALVLTVLVAGPAVAQGTLGRLVGTVLDSSGGVLPGARVTLSNAATGFRLAEVTNSQGGFSFPQVPIGTYQVVVELGGFKTASYRDVVINVGQEYSLTAKLEVGEVRETVNVLAGVSLVKTTTPEVSTTVLQQQVLEIPLGGRSVTNLINLQAGVPGLTNRRET